MNGGSKPLHFAAHSLQSEADGEHVLIGVSLLFRQVLKVIDAVASNDCVVLLEGESGTGKELLARRIHTHSARANGPFIPVNCPGISETLFESQFYGHIKGAFTGAMTDTLGAVKAAQDGTLLLDEVAELPLHLQPKLLRLLQEREVTPVGASRPIPVNARFIAATNRDLLRRVAEGAFRGDLYHRLNIVRVKVPPLRDRPEDVEPLLDHYLDYYARQYCMPKRQVSPYLRKRLVEHHWPGNVRELCGYVERLYAANLPPMPPSQGTWFETSSVSVAPAAGRMPLTDSAPLSYSLADAESRTIHRALETTGYNRSAAARLLGIHRTTLLRKMRSFGIDASSR